MTILQISLGRKTYLLFYNLLLISITPLSPSMSIFTLQTFYGTNDHNQRDRPADYGHFNVKSTIQQITRGETPPSDRSLSGSASVRKGQDVQVTGNEDVVELTGPSPGDDGIKRGRVSSQDALTQR